MVAAGKAKTHTERPAGVNIPRSLAQAIDRLLKEYPEYGTNRSDFATRCVAVMMREIRQEIRDHTVLEAYRMGKPGPFAELQRMRL